MAQPSLPKFTPTFHNDTYPAISPTSPTVSAAGKTILITGGGRGIGHAIAEAFAAAGASNIILTARSRAQLDSVKQKIETSSKAKVYIFSVDVADKITVGTMFDTIRDSIGQVDTLVSNASYLSPACSMMDADIDDWWRCYQTNILGAALITRGFLSVAAPAPVMINVTAGMTHSPPIPGFSAYTGSKEGFLKVMDYVQIEKPLLRVVNVHPGVVRTQMLDVGFANTDLLQHIPFDDVRLPADFIVWVASPEGQFLKGRYVWCNWDVNELKEMKDEIVKKDLLKMSLRGWPRVDENI